MRWVKPERKGLSLIDCSFKAKQNKTYGKTAANSISSCMASRHEPRHIMRDFSTGEEGFLGFMDFGRSNVPYGGLKDEA